MVIIIFYYLYYESRSNVIIRRLLVWGVLKLNKVIINTAIIIVIVENNEWLQILLCWGLGLGLLAASSSNNQRDLEECSNKRKMNKEVVTLTACLAYQDLYLW